MAWFHGHSHRRQSNQSELEMLNPEGDSKDGDEAGQS